MAGDPTRRIDLAKIHIAAKQLHLDEDVYRSIVRRVSAKFRGTPVESSGKLNARERAALISELTSFGFKVAPPRKRNPNWIETRDLHLRKLLALWGELARTGEMKDSSKAALRRFVNRATGKDAIQWLSPEECNKVIEMLKAWRKRLDGAEAEAVVSDDAL
ncbi:MAG: regulatory protein GemA [Candidatus Binatus sp.]|uniref:regulatory protein GemA n=1 Tax=Candidatus Binatus sp. TaxID=2811406 RepID=UPI00271C7278|nr:regulatory protein GemA [Candidatus Binatus sp.]MDO8431777.1 regulatory protein GemA [Candidatus Binatus sp.]